MTNFPKLKTPRKQTPICEGEYVNRLFFNASEPGSHYSYIPITFDGKKYTLKAGVAQGITTNSRFGIYETNITGSDNPQIGTCRVTTEPGEHWVSLCRLGDTERDWFNRLHQPADIPRPDNSLLQVPTTASVRPPISRGTIDSIGPEHSHVVAFAQLVESKSTHTLDVFFTDTFRKGVQGDKSQPSLDLKLPLHVEEFPSEDGANAVLGFDAQSTKVTFSLRLSSEEESNHRSCVLPHTVPTDSKKLEAVLFSMLQWRWHSLRNPPNGSRSISKHLQVELHKLKKDDGDGSLLPDGENLNIGGEATIFPSSKVFYGFKIINSSPRPLFVYPFYFSTANQSIRPLFLRVHGGDGTDAPMDRHSDMKMGCGDDDHLPISFQPTNTTEISEGVLDIGIVRFFITTEHADFESVAQASPFAALGWVGRGEDEFSDGLCFARKEHAMATLGGENVKNSVDALPPQDNGFMVHNDGTNWNAHRWDVVDMKIIIRRNPQ